MFELTHIRVLKATSNKQESGNIWKRDRMHKDHYDMTDPKTGKKVKEVDYSGNKIWPNGSKNKKINYATSIYKIRTG